MAKASTDPKHYLKVAAGHLKRVQDAWNDPTDWSDLATYGLYCLEASIRAAALKDGVAPAVTHWDKVKQARDLTARRGLPDVADLLKDLNDLRKAEAYGDSEVDESQYDAQDIAGDVEQYFDAVEAFCK